MLGVETPRGQLERILEACQCSVELPAELDDFFEHSGPTGGSLAEQRRFPRVNLRTPAALRYRQTLHALPRAESWHKVFVKDISRCGVAFLHGEQLYPNERMALLMPDGTRLPVEVVRCRRLGARCYEIGVRFVAEDAAAQATEVGGGCRGP